MKPATAITSLGYGMLCTIVLGFAWQGWRLEADLQTARQALAAAEARSWVAAGRAYPRIYSARWVARWECADRSNDFLAPAFLRGALKGCEAQLEVYRSGDLEAVRARIQSRVLPGARVWVLEERGELERPLNVDWTASIRR